jgi:hypothetical protein
MGERIQNSGVQEFRSFRACLSAWIRIDTDLFESLPLKNAAEAMAGSSLGVRGLGFGVRDF